MKLKKSFGQHLLIAPGILQKIVELADIKPGEVVVEIGPGTGNLTLHLLKTKLRKLYLIELDKEMVKLLQEKIKDPRVELICADAKSFDFSSLSEKQLKLIGNLPYNVASLIIENTINFKDLISEAYYMVQKEVAERLKSTTSWLGTFVNTFYKISYLMTIPPRFFLPPPKVYSAFLALKKRSDFALNIDPKLYKKFLTKLYKQKRKMLKHKIEEEILIKAGISPSKRVEELCVADFVRLFKYYSVLFEE